METSHDVLRTAAGEWFGVQRSIQESMSVGEKLVNTDQKDTTFTEAQWVILVPLARIEFLVSPDVDSKTKSLRVLQHLNANLRQLPVGDRPQESEFSIAERVPNTYVRPFIDLIMRTEGRFSVEQISNYRNRVSLVVTRDPTEYREQDIRFMTTHIPLLQSAARHWFGRTFTTEMATMKFLQDTGGLSLIDSDGQERFDDFADKELLFPLSALLSAKQAIDTRTT